MAIIIIKIHVINNRPIPIRYGDRIPLGYYIFYTHFCAPEQLPFPSISCTNTYNNSCSENRWPKGKRVILSVADDRQFIHLIGISVRFDGLLVGPFDVIVSNLIWHNQYRSAYLFMYYNSSKC